MSCFLFDPAFLPASFPLTHPAIRDGQGGRWRSGTARQCHGAVQRVCVWCWCWFWFYFRRALGSLSLRPRLASCDSDLGRGSRMYSRRRVLPLSRPRHSTPHHPSAPSPPTHPANSPPCFHFTSLYRTLYSSHPPSCRAQLSSSLYTTPKAPCTPRASLDRHPSTYTRSYTQRR